GERVRLPVEPGTRSRLHLRVWNKTDAPLALTLQPAAARVDGDGSPELGGDPAPVAWVALDATEITLGPRRQRIVTMTVEPSGTVDGSHAVAILATPADQAANPAVLERLGVVVELHAGPIGAGGAADGSGSVAGVPLLVALLGLGCVAAVGIGAWRLRRHADALPLGPARL
ncbi:MAG TPA: hypothetical protein VM618_03305, partial [Acidimicrobiia bacterium]|nr:hypothetical protein [Acidimicrobiia bacterium]